VDLYQTADIYIDPSLYEGFGLQVLEAMSCGVPVLCSNTTSLAEIVGDAAITCKPTDAEAFADGIEYLVSNPMQANLMTDAGIRHASDYSWSKTVAQLVDLCEHAID
jgi:glycosyltransferase involved in cell wall biosynthesis